MVLEDRVGILVARLAAALGRNGWKMAAAESCTGGWISKICTDLPGSSDWFERGFVTYSNEAKMEMLGVEAGVLKSHGAVSREVAEQMAMGAIKYAPIQASLAVTGVAGPDGGSEDKPVGTVWFAWSFGEQQLESECCRFSGGRDEVRRKTVEHALQGLLLRLQSI
jgi:nicotinamide-nucleotide amidase